MAIAKAKRAQRDAAIPSAWRLAPGAIPDDRLDVTAVPAECGLLTAAELAITETRADVLVQGMLRKEVSSYGVTLAFCKRAAIAQQVTNCLSEIFFEQALENSRRLDEQYAQTGIPSGPLHGLPVSLKDCFVVEGVDAAIGTTAHAMKPGKAEDESEITKIMRTCGAVLFCKTTVPFAMMAGETFNNLYGYTANPFNRTLTSGGSSGGESALLAMHGSPLGVGTDVGGSLRIPAAFCGLYTLKPSYGRFPTYGCLEGLAGQEAVKSVNGPMAPSVDALDLWSRAVVGTEPWTDGDHSCIPIPWRNVTLPEKLCFGIVVDDGFVKPLPPVARALAQTRAALEALGHTVIDFPIHDPLFTDALKFALYRSSGARLIHDTLAKTGEPWPVGFEMFQSMMQAAQRGERDVLGVEATVSDLWVAQALRGEYARKFLISWANTRGKTGTGREIDALLMPCAPWSASKRYEFVYDNYTSLWNVLDHCATTLPVTVVSPDLDASIDYAGRNPIEEAIWKDCMVDKVVLPSDPAWWKEATASFADHAANGHGTMRGIAERVPYLKDLGVDIIWLSPCYESPQKDMGYDISNYLKIDPRYGTLEDWDAVRDACHERGMKLVMDLVVNHTSDQHAWFKESRSSKTSPKRNWYFWHPGKVDEHGVRHPPNNWKNSFGPSSAWEWDDETQEYYLHLYLTEQPDLNWENVAVREAVYDVMRWWLDRGADGFRMDVINYISKAPGLPDAPVTVPGRPYQAFNELSVDRPRVHDFLKEMHERVLSHYDCFAVGECPGAQGPESFALYSKPECKELQMVFHFHHQGFDRLMRPYGRSWNPKWTLSGMKKIFNTWNVEMAQHGGWNSNYLENHDQSRIISRLGSDHPSNRLQSAKLCCMFHTTLTGTLFIYQGQEIGMVNVPADWGEHEYKDIEAIKILAGEREFLRQQGVEGDVTKEVMKSLRMTARDNGRTPMQWDASPNAGFSKATPWMRVHDDYETWNVATQRADPGSAWHFWKRMLEIRKQHPALLYGDFTPLDNESNENYSYIRHHAATGERILVVLNFARGDDGMGRSITWDPAVNGVDMAGATLLISNNAEAGSSHL
ncbi:hypothetical protein Q5752_006688 [Cryptotrichosporon argae]